MIVERDDLVNQIDQGLREAPVTAMLGPRQCGKTTLARSIFGRGRGGWKPGMEEYFDLQDPLDRARLQSPRDTLARLRGLVVIDEVQQMPELFPILRVLADEPGPAERRFLILGSASPTLVANASETLAGRVQRIHMGGLHVGEWDGDRNDLWYRGGFPRSVLAPDDAASLRWRRNYIDDFLGRDLRDFGIAVPPERMRRFWMIVASLHGDTWNSSAVASALGVSHPTARDYVDILSEAYVVRQLKPFLTNTKKRQVKSPKVYIRDSGILHALLGLQDLDSVKSHHKYGASWEGFALEQVASLLQATPDDLTFWGTHGNAEIDLVWQRDGKTYGFEFKATESPSRTRSMSIAMQDLRLEKVFVIHPGDHVFSLGEGVEAVGYGALPEFVSTLLNGAEH